MMNVDIIAKLSFSEIQYLAIDTNNGLTMEEDKAINFELKRRLS